METNKWKQANRLWLGPIRQTWSLFSACAFQTHSKQKEGSILGEEFLWHCPLLAELGGGWLVWSLAIE